MPGDEDLVLRLAAAGLSDPPGARAALRRMAADPEEERALEALLPHLLRALGQAAGPDAVLVSLERFSQSVRDRLALWRDLAEHPRWTEILVALFSGSQFLTEILLQHPDMFLKVVLPKLLAVRKPSGQVHEELRGALAEVRDPSAATETLRRYQRLELLRIGASDLLGLFDLETVIAELSGLADGLVAAALDVAARDAGKATEGFAVIAMGKLGGRELNYSSDIDLLFVARTDAPGFWGVGRRVIDLLGRFTGEGFLYRVDMRLRPWGEAGPLVSSVDSYLDYLATHARLWERQALLKARVVAGDGPVGEECLARAQRVVFSAPAEAVRREVRAMRERTEEAIRRKGLERTEVKLGEGSIRDVEFVVQYLQLAHGGRLPALRCGNTLESLGRLEENGLLAPSEARILREGYVFLRTVEHHLQVMHYRQTHVLPAGPGPLGELARRLGFAGPAAGPDFQYRYREHTAAIRAIYRHHLGDQKMTVPTDTTGPTSPLQRQHVARMDPSYAETFTAEEIARHARLAEELDDRRLSVVRAERLGSGRWRATIVGWDFPGELSLICGLLFANGFSIEQADAFTYEPAEEPAETAPRARPRFPAPDELPDAARLRGRPRRPSGRPDARKKTVDVFTVASLKGDVEGATWERFETDLVALLDLLRSGRQLEARGEIARRAAVTQQAIAGAASPLAPVDIEIDNASSDRYTVLHIDAPDTNGFLYELTNALAQNGVYIARMTAGSVGSRVRDTLWVTDASRAKITSPERQRELRATTVLIKHFTHLLPHSPNPESALLHFGELVGQLFSRPNWAAELSSLESPRVLDRLAQLLGVSDFLWSDFLRMQHANLFPLVENEDEGTRAKAKADLEAELSAALKEADEARSALNAFKDRELFRVDMRYILGRSADIAQFSAELTDLADVVVAAAFRLAHEELAADYGTLRLPGGAPAPDVVCGLGKCGGRELGFASDIELLFLHGGEGETDGRHRVGASEYFEKLGQAFVGLVRTRKEGVFAIDLRLRPYGSAGPMAVSLDAFRRYYAADGPAWPYERQSLIRLRPVAGDEELGRRVVALRDEIVYEGSKPDVAAHRAMRERQVRQLVSGGTLNLKFSPGGLVDVEYLVQLLQMSHGREDLTLRTANTRDAMTALAAAGILSSADLARLREAHTVLRSVIEALRVVTGNAADVTLPPFESEAFSFLARRLGHGRDLARLRDDVLRVTASVREIGARLLG